MTMVMTNFASKFWEPHTSVSVLRQTRDLPAKFPPKTLFGASHCQNNYIRNLLIVLKLK